MTEHADRDAPDGVKVCAHTVALECGDCGHPVAEHEERECWYRWYCPCGCMIVIEP